MDTRARLVAEAARLFAQHGYAATSIRDIANAADCNLALIKHYFGSKADLLRETVVTSMQRAAAAHAESRGDDPEAELEQAIGRLLETFYAARDDGLPIVAAELLHPESEFAADFAARARENVDALAKLLSALKRRGLLEPGIDPQTAAVLLIGMLQIYFVARPVTEPVLGKPSPEVLADLREHVTSIFLRGVLRRKGSR